MCGPILWSIKRTQKWVCRPSILVHEIDSKLGPPIRHESQPKTKSAFAHFVFCGSVGQGNRSRALPEHWRGTDLRERLFGRTVALDLAPRLQGVLHTAVGPLATLLRLFQWFSQTHFLIMTFVSIVLIDAFFYHDAFFYGSRGCIFLS